MNVICVSSIYPYPEQEKGEDNSPMADCQEKQASYDAG
jgi:hypothetical protein